MELDTTTDGEPKESKDRIYLHDLRDFNAHVSRVKQATKTNSKNHYHGESTTPWTRPLCGLVCYSIRFLQ